MGCQIATVHDSKRSVHARTLAPTSCMVRVMSASDVVDRREQAVSLRAGQRWGAAFVVGVAGLFAGVPCVRADAAFVIVNADGPDEGFNDPTPATPIGGNSGTTLGEQRMIAVQHAFDIWGEALESPVPLIAEIAFEDLCTSGALARTQTRFVRRYALPVALDLPADVRGIPAALARRLAPESFHRDEPDFVIEFTDQKSCVSVPWDYGLSAGRLYGLVEAALHEIGHGLGFNTLIDVNDGAEPDFFATLLYDTLSGKRLLDLDVDERVRALAAGRTASGPIAATASWRPVKSATTARSTATPFAPPAARIARPAVAAMACATPASNATRAPTTATSGRALAAPTVPWRAAATACSTRTSTAIRAAPTATTRERNAPCAAGSVLVPAPRPAAGAVRYRTPAQLPPTLNAMAAVMPARTTADRDATRATTRGASPPARMTPVAPVGSSATIRGMAGHRSSCSCWLSSPAGRADRCSVGPRRVPADRATCRTPVRLVYGARHVRERGRNRTPVLRSACFG